jgi:SlyX protein
VNTEERFVDIEIKLAHQEDMVEELNQALYQQGRKIDQLEAMVSKLADHIRTSSQNSGGPVNEPPPHY